MGDVAGRPLLAAPVTGAPAWVIGRLLDQHLPGTLSNMQAGNADPALLEDVRRTWQAIREAGREWSLWRVSADVRLPPLPAEMPPPSAREISTEQAAALLDVTPSRVRQLLRDQVLTGRKVGERQWLVDRCSVDLHAQTRYAA